MNKKTKNVLKGILIIVIVVVVLIIFNSFYHSYSVNAKVYLIEGEVITFEDMKGHCWKWTKEENEEEYKEREKVVILFYDNNTIEEPTDDIIVRVKRNK